MKRKTAARFWGLLALLATSAPAEESPVLDATRRALDEALPQVAIAKIKAAMAAGQLSGVERDRGLALLAEALLAAGQPAEALATLQPLADRGDAAARLLRAKCLAATGRWDLALPIFRELAALPGASLAARLGEAESWRAVGNSGKAVQTLEALASREPGVPAVSLRLAGLLVEAQNAKRARVVLTAVRPVEKIEKNWARYLEARLLILEKQPAAALAAFEQLAEEREGVSASLLVNAALGATDARVALQGSENADKTLETYIWRHPDSAYLDIAFRRLDQIYAQQENPAQSELQKWAGKPEEARAAFGRFYLARAQLRGKRRDKAAVTLDAFIQSHPSHPLLPQAQLMRADLFLESGDLKNAIRALEGAERSAGTEELRAEIQFRTGLVLDRQRQYLLAGNEFDRAGERVPGLRESALFNAALTGLQAQNYDRFLEVYGRLNAAFPESPRRGDAMLEQGLTQARMGDARAQPSLIFFLNYFPLHPRVPEAHLALAELSYQTHDAPGVARYLRVTNETARAPETQEQARYLSIVVAGDPAQADEAQLIARALDFIRAFPQSALLPEVRMKLGQVYFKQGDFPNAETQLVTLARESPTGPYAEAGLFLAGQAAMRSINPGAVDRALALFADVVKRAGPLKLYARQQQAIVSSKPGKEGEAITLYDLILSATPPPEPELRYAALCGKGDNLLVMGRSEPERLQGAVQVFAQLAAWPGVPRSWRNQALYKKAHALEQLEQGPEALIAYYDVLDRNESESREFFWYYKAGFDAARIFEQKEDWASAIGIYEKMARLDGPRAGEAKAAARQLRLAHFIWE